MGSKKVTMTLTDLDLKNVDAVAERTHARSKAQAVSNSLNLAAFITEQVAKNGAQVLIRTPDGELQRVVLPEIEASR